MFTTGSSIMYQRDMHLLRHQSFLADKRIACMNIHDTLRPAHLNTTCCCCCCSSVLWESVAQAHSKSNLQKPEELKHWSASVHATLLHSSLHLFCCCYIVAFLRIHLCFVVHSFHDCTLWLVSIISESIMSQWTHLYFMYHLVIVYLL